MKMKCFSILLSCFSLFAALGAAPEKGLLFHASFDGFSTLPDHAANRKTQTFGIRPDLQMRMFDGPPGKRNAVLVDNQEFIGYTPAGNFNPKCGTVSLWVKPVNWKGSSSGYQTFFEVRGNNNKYRLIINKESRGGLINFLLLINGKAYVTRSHCGWNTGEWHKLDCTWNESKMSFYVDGKAPGKGSMAQRIFKGSPGFPDRLTALLRLNYVSGWRVDKTWKTAYDELKIYNRVLSPDEILTEYEKVFPAKKTVHRAFAAVPAVLPVSAPHPACDLKTPFDATVELAVRNDRLVLDFKVPKPAGKWNITQRDGELWLNDSVEFHVLGSDGRQRQFIVNADGALYDSMDKDAKWNSEAVSSAARQPDGWTAHLEIPLKDLGGGRRFKANFGIADPSAQYRWYTWNPLPTKKTLFADREYFGTLELGDESDRVELRSLGDLRAGNLDVRSSAAPGIKTAVRVVCSSGGKYNTAKASLPSGRAELVFEASKSGKKVYSYSRSFVVNPPLTMTVLALYPRRLIEFRLDFSASGMTSGSGEVSLLLNGKTLAERKFQADKPEFTAALALPENLPDNCVCIARAKVGPYSADQPFRIPDMTPVKAKTAVNHDVPSPWLPVRIKDGTAEVLDRVYSFRSGPLPDSIVSRGQQLIAGQPVFLLNGKAIRWENVKFGRNYGDYVELSARGKFPGGSAAIKGEIWFDGMYKFDLSLQPEKPLKIRSFDLQWSVPREIAHYALTPEYTPWDKDSLRLKWDTREYNSLFWLTGYVNGLAWWCKSDANWIIDPNAFNIIAKRNAKTADVTVKMFARPAVLKKTADYTFVFQATPPKHPDRKEREIHHGLRWFRTADVAEMAGDSRSGRKDAEGFRNWTSLVPWDAAAMRKSLQKLHVRGYQSQMYSMPAHISRLDPEYDYFIRYSAIQPSTLWGALDPDTKENYVVEPCCGNTPVADIHAWRLEKLFREVPEIDCMYFDISHVRQCENPSHGCGGTDAFGKKYTSSFALNLRSYLLRVLKISQKYHKRLGLHAHNAYFPFVHDLCNYWMPGEELFYPIGKNPDWGYLEYIPEPAWQSAWNSTIRGVHFRVIGQHDRLTRVLKMSKKEMEHLQSSELAIHFLTAMVLYDCDMQAFGSQKKDNPMFGLWKIRKEVNLAKAQFHGYWNEPAAEAAPSIRVSWYSWQGKSKVPVMFCVGNIRRKAAKTGIRIDWNKAGLAAPEKVRDLWTGRTFTASELAAYELGGHHFMLLVPEPGNQTK